MDESHDRQMLVSTILKRLSHEARLNEDDETGNEEYSRGLRQMIKALRPYSHTPISKLSRILTGATKESNAKSAEFPFQWYPPLKPAPPRNDRELNTKELHSVERTAVKSVSRRPRADLPRDLESLCQEDVERIIDDGSYTKRQLAELGFRRFGISRSSLIHLRKEDAVNSVRAALRNERTLDVISEMAQRAGRARTN